MKIYSLSILRVPPTDVTSSVLLSNATELSSYSFYQRGSVGEFMTLITKTVAERTPRGQRQSVRERGYVAHVYNHGGDDGLAAVIITDEEYPARAAFSVLTKLLDEFSAKVPQGINTSTPSSTLFPEISTYLQRYQDPRQADTIMRVQQELDETKIVLHKTIESVLQRGEKLDDLVERSGALSTQTKLFYRTTKNQNACCVMM
ncbi:snare protein YKT6 [Crassisporium funariophilum]|nr:snare protein YKT6 [Crassisporium funariophilum]